MRSKSGDVCGGLRQPADFTQLPYKATYGYLAFYADGNVPGVGRYPYLDFSIGAFFEHASNFLQIRFDDE